MERYAKYKDSAEEKDIGVRSSILTDLGGV